MNMMNNAVNAWWPLLFYPATDAPRFHKGMIAMICTCVATLGVTWLVWFLERREWRLYGKPGECSPDDHAIEQSSDVAESAEAKQEGEKRESGSMHA